MEEEIIQLVEKILPKTIDIRRQLHQIPELGYAEFKTAELIANTLTSYGYAAQTGVAGTGVIAILDSGRSGPTLALRADMDALPITEASQPPYRSQHPGAMHACGHDGHTATLLAVAWVLQKLKNQLNGKVKLIFQPAEEGGKGSLAMIENHVLKNPDVDAIFGFHNWPGLPTRTIATRKGTLLAGSGRFEIHIAGQPAHSSTPAQHGNPISMGSQVVVQLDELKKHSDSSKIVFNVLSFQGGDPKRGMAQESTIVGVYYVESSTELQQMQTAVEELVRRVAQEHQGEINVNFRPFHPPTINSEEETQTVFKAAHDLFESDQVQELPNCMMVAEDFSEYLERIPGCFFLVGAGMAAPTVHTDTYDFNDDIIAPAAAVFCQIVLARCSRDDGGESGHRLLCR